MYSAEQARALFPALNQYHDDYQVCFLDGPGGTQIPERVSEAMRNYFDGGNSNLGGVFACSADTGRLVEKARQTAADFVNAPSSDHIAFGANMTSLTFSLSRAISRDWRAGDEIIVSSLDHFANVSPWQMAAEDKGVIVNSLAMSADECQLDLKQLPSLISKRTKLIAVTCASNLTGTIVDVQKIVALAKKVGAKVYLDAVHFAPHQLIDVQAFGCDFLVCSAYKFFGPHLGIAYIASPWLDQLRPYKVKPAPEKGPARFETGTLNFEALAGFNAAVNYLASWSVKSTLRERLEECYQHYLHHEERLSAHFLSKLDGVDGVSLHGTKNSQHRTPTFALSFDDMSPQTIAEGLAKKHIYVWNGHFYAVEAVKTLNKLEGGGVLRVGFMHYNTEDEIDRFFSALVDVMSVE